MFANHKIMAKKKLKTESNSGKRKPYLIPIPTLAETAKQIFMLKPNETIILNRLKEIYVEAFDVGYQRRISDNRHFNVVRNRRIKKSLDSVFMTIDDNIHGGLVPKKQNID